MRWLGLLLVLALGGCQTGADKESDVWDAELKFAAKAFDDCALRNFRAYRPASSSPDAAAEAAFDSCSTEERAVLAVSTSNPRISYEAASGLLAQRRAKLKQTMVKS